MKLTSNIVVLFAFATAITTNVVVEGRYNYCDSNADCDPTSNHPVCVNQQMCEECDYNTGDFGACGGRFPCCGETNQCEEVDSKWPKICP